MFWNVFWLFHLVFANTEAIIVKSIEFGRGSNIVPTELILSLPFEESLVTSVELRKGTNITKYIKINQINKYKLFQIKLCWPAVYPIDVSVRVCNPCRESIIETVFIYNGASIGNDIENILYKVTIDHLVFGFIPSNTITTIIASVFMLFMGYLCSSKFLRFWIQESN
jgi:hypothetical protein